MRNAGPKKKLTEEQEDEIFVLWKDLEGASMERIANRFGVSRTTAYRAIRSVRERGSFAFVCDEV